MGEKKMSNTYDYTESNDCFIGCYKVGCFEANSPDLRQL